MTSQSLSVLTFPVIAASIIENFHLEVLYSALPYTFFTIFKAMASKMVILEVFYTTRVHLLLLPSLLLFIMLHGLVDAEFTNHLIHKLCSNTTNYTSGSAFQNNLNRLLIRSLYNDGGDYIFSNATQGTYPDQVYGLFLCRADVARKTCQDCIDMASEMIVDECPFRKEAIIWYDECLIRYSDTSFLTTMRTSPSVCASNSGNVSQPIRFDQEMRSMFVSLAKEATSDPLNCNFAKSDVNISGFKKLYGMVQCTPDLSPLDCSNCLDAAVDYIPSCPLGEVGGSVLTPSCNVRYQQNPFIAEVSAPEPPAASSNKVGQTSGECLLVFHYI